MNATSFKNIFEYKRLLTREVKIGDVACGGQNPIRLQSMTTTDTMDTTGTIAQSIRMIEAGSEYVRITAPSKKEAQNLAPIKQGLLAAGHNTPLVADIHFTPNAAEIAAKIVKKVRVNPGNYADKKKFAELDFTDASYDAELARISKKFTPLVSICKEHGTAMRIGTNHGSLSDRIMSRYGDTPLGMVESALEFVRICEDLDYYDIVISMKASNVQVMVQAYRLLVQQMLETGRSYPLHLGVTEAGEAEDGRIKSAIGIGALLEDGIGDTIRVSLTEAPEAEIPVARKIAQRYASSEPALLAISAEKYNPFEYIRRETNSLKNIGADQVPIVIADLHLEDVNEYDNYAQIGYTYNPALDKYNIAEAAADYVFLGDNLPTISLPGQLKPIVSYGAWQANGSKPNYFPFISYAELNTSNQLHTALNFVAVIAEEITEQELLNHIGKPLVWVVNSARKNSYPAFRRLGLLLQNIGSKQPIIYQRNFPKTEEEQLIIDASIDLGCAFVDGYGDGIWLHAAKTRLDKLNYLAFGILQATRTRISKTEYISCPSCGRTLFDLQETTAMIRAKTDHLKGLKIGIMGCIVNGPGEMADADYGYVGSGVDKITLYRGKEVVKKGIPTNGALEELIEIIKEDGNWVELV